MMELDIYKKNDAIYNILDILSKSCVTHIFSHNFVRIKINSYDSLPLEKTLTSHNVLIFIKSVLNKNQNHNYYNILLEKCSFKLLKNNNDK